MYKRKPKSGGLGIVRTINQLSKSEENTNPNISANIHIKETPTPTHNKDNSLIRQKSLVTEKNEDEDLDEVVSDSEPSPKKSRRFVSNSLSLSKELSFQKFVPTSSSSFQKKSFGQKQTNEEEFPSSQNKSGLITSPRKKAATFKPRPTIVGYESRQEKVAKRTTNSYLEDLFKKSGLILSDGDSSNILKTDQALFIRDINEAISSTSSDMKRNVEQLLKDLEKYISSEKCLKYAVSYTETSSECDVSRGATQDSLMRMLLHIDCVQTQITELLMDKLTKFVMDEDSNESETPVITWVRMILQCFRFLDRMLSGNLVCERLLDIVLATSNTTIQQEVIISLPDIITDAEHHHAALELSKLVRKSKPGVMASALEALTNLSLQLEVRAEIQPILIKALNKVQPEFLPTILKFLFTDCDAPLMDEIITYLRNDLDLCEVAGDVASIQVLVFSTLRDTLLSSRTLSSIWLKNISNVKTQAEHKPIDIIMLLVMLSTTNDATRQRAIEAVFRSKIRADLFIETLISETLESYIAVIKEHFQVTTKLAGSLLKSTDPAVVDFASKMYTGMFVNMEGLWCKWVLTDLQVCVGAGDSNVARSALNILQHLTNNHHHKVKPLGIILMLLLNKLGDLALGEVRQLMDILCHIAYSEDDTSLSDCSILQDEINILVQKQLASSQLTVLRSGVVGCVMTIKHITSVSQSTNSESTDPNITSEKAKRAVQLLEMLLTSTRNNVEAHGLALDQLSHLLILGSTALDPSFLQKLSSLMRDNLQESFLISKSDFVDKEEVVKSSLQFFLDDLDDETEDPIALNLSPLVSAETNSSQAKSTMSVRCIHSLLRLLRGLELADLSEIDALLGCYIAMPVPAVYQEFSQLSAYQQHVALHCLFHCINWLHEVINCFAYLIKERQPKKLLMRLRTIVHLRGLLSRCLPLAMEYTPPVCHFQALPKPKAATAEKAPKKLRKKKGKKKGKKRKAENDQSVLTGNPNSSQQQDEEEEEDEEEEDEVKEEKLADLSKYKQYFRELDTDVWLYLTQPLTLSPTPEKNGKFTAELGPNELLFILDDYVTKLSHSLTTSNKRLSALKTAQGQSVGFDNLDRLTPLQLAKNTIKLMPSLCNYLEKTMEFTQNLVKVNDGILDSTGMFMEGSAEIKKCQGKLLKILAVLFSWVGFQNPANTNYLIAGLKMLASRVSCDKEGSQAKTRSKKMLVRESLNYLTQCHEHVLDLTTACTLVELMKALAHHADDDKNLSENIGTICGEFLGRQWYDLKGNREKGAVLNSQLKELLSGFLSHSADQLTAVTHTNNWLVSESQQLLSEKDANLKTFPAFNKLNLHILVEKLLKGLEGAVKQKLADQPSDKEQLVLWSSFTYCLETLVMAIKTHDSKANLRAFMKGSTVVLRQFLTHGMPTCTFMFKHDPNSVSQILKKLQVTTRYIQTICNFVKVSKDTGLTQFLPAIRAVLETILLRVKSIIVINNCADAFFMGSMKNRDLKGQEILSEETLPEEDDTTSIAQASGSESEKEEDANEENESNNEEESEETNESISV